MKIFLTVRRRGATAAAYLSLIAPESQGYSRSDSKLFSEWECRAIGQPRALFGARNEKKAARTEKPPTLLCELT